MGMYVPDHHLLSVFYVENADLHSRPAAYVLRRPVRSRLSFPLCVQSFVSHFLCFRFTSSVARIMLNRRRVRAVQLLRRGVFCY